MNSPITPVSRLLATIFVLVLAGCAAAPLSYIEGVPQTRVDSTLYPVRVVSVDGDIQFGGKPVQVSPGPRWMVFEAAAGSRSRTVQKSFVFKVEPCTRYFFAAKKTSAMASEWSLVVDQKETVVGCNVEEELKKAEMASSPMSVQPGASAAR